MAEPIVKLRDRHGPYAGMVRDYLKSAAEVAVQTGFAERVEDPAPLAAAPAPAPKPAATSKKRGAK